MKNNKLTIIVLGLVFCGLLMGVAWGFAPFFIHGKRTVVTTYTNLPAASSTASRGSGQMTQGPATVAVPTASGTVTIANPAQVPTAQVLGGGQYSVTDPNNTQADFNVVYSTRDGSFAVALLNEPIAKARTEAGQYLLSTLHISQAQLCLLNVYVGVPRSINQFYSGKNLGFSFCPNAVQLQ